MSRVRGSWRAAIRAEASGARPPSATAGRCRGRADHAVMGHAGAYVALGHAPDSLGIGLKSWNDPIQFVPLQDSAGWPMIGGKQAHNRNPAISLVASPPSQGGLGSGPARKRGSVDGQRFGRTPGGDARGFSASLGAHPERGTRGACQSTSLIPACRHARDGQRQSPLLNRSVRGAPSGSGASVDTRTGSHGVPGNPAISLVATPPSQGGSGSAPSVDVAASPDTTSGSPWCLAPGASCFHPPSGLEHPSLT